MAVYWPIEACETPSCGFRESTNYIAQRRLSSCTSSITQVPKRLQQLHHATVYSDCSSCIGTEKLPHASPKPRRFVDIFLAGAMIFHVSSV